MRVWLGAGAVGLAVALLTAPMSAAAPQSSLPPATPVPQAQRCALQRYEGIEYCTLGPIHLLRIDPKAAGVRFEAVLAEGYDRDGEFGECRDVAVPAESTGPGCERRGRYPVEAVGHMARRYPGAVAAVNADFFGEAYGPIGLTVKNGVRLDGRYGDHDENEVRRGSLSISAGGDVRIGIVSRESLPDPDEPWHWRPHPGDFFTTIGGTPLLIVGGERVDLHRQCLQEASIDFSGCPLWRKACTCTFVVDAPACPAAYELRARTAVGRTADGCLLIVVAPETPGLTLIGLVDALLALGAVEALNLDGGRSSQLWYDGRYRVTPERSVASGLLVFAEASR